MFIFWVSIDPTEFIIDLLDCWIL